MKTMTLTDVDAAALFARLGSLEDPRARRGLRHSQRSLIAIILCAVISGAQGPTAIGEWVKRLPPAIIARKGGHRPRKQPRPLKISFDKDWKMTVLPIHTS
jgi:hypothetical protein